MVPNLREKLETARLKARIITETLGKCDCNQRLEFADLLNSKDNPDLVMEKALDLSDQIQSQWIDKIRALSFSCRDLGEFHDRLIGLFGEMDTAKMGLIMSQAMGIGNLVGRAEVQDEIK